MSTGPVVTGPTGARTYHLVEAIGQGGFGAVYRGRIVGAAGFEKTVAIKLLLAEAAVVPDMVRRLRDEARLLARLRHRSIVQVDDLVELDGRWGVVMEYVEGADLQHLLQGGPLPPRVAVEVAQEVAAALQAAHDAVDPETGSALQIVHRDIKPANIRLTPQGEVKVLDFGVARATFPDREAVTRSVSFGSEGYMSPERFDGIDLPSCDVYALGVVLCESLLGRRVGQLSVSPDRHAEVLAGHLAAVDAIDPGLAATLATMLAYEPEERPTAADVVRALRERTAGLPGPWLADWAPRAVTPAPRRTGPLAGLPPASRGEPKGEAPAPTGTFRVETGVAPPRSGPPAWLLAGLAAAVLLAAGIAGGLWMTRSPAPAPEPAPLVVLEPPPAAVAAPPVVVEAPEVAPVIAAEAPSRTRKAVAVAAAVVAPPPTGRVEVQGDGAVRLLLGDRGYPAGDLPVGTYRLEATFAGGVVIRPERAVAVTAGQTVTVVCSSAQETCAVRP